MAASTRRLVEKERLRRRILDAALDLFITNGYHAVSMRQIASRIEYSAAAIYLYFRDKNDIYFELMREGFRQLTERQHASRSIPDPMERLTAHGRAYVDFAFEHPHLYEIMFTLPGPEAHLTDEQDWTDTLGSYETLREDVRACQEAGYFPGEDPETVAFTAWSLVHGAVSLVIGGRMRMVSPEQRRAVIAGFTDFLPRMLRSGGAPRSGTDAVRAKPASSRSRR